MIDTRLLDDPTLAARLDALDWRAIERELDVRGWATTGVLWSRDECERIAACYGDDGRFRSRVVMQRHGFGRGEYRYFAYPLPHAIAALRETLYRRLRALASRWWEARQRGKPSGEAEEPTATLGLGDDADLAMHDGTSVFPPHHDAYLARCHAAGQTRPTPLLLSYAAGDYNCLHRDLYGELAFPLQAAFLLSEPGRDFTGGEFVLTEQRPRAQSAVSVVPLRQGEAVIFAVDRRPVTGTQRVGGVPRVHHVAMKHGVSTVRSGHRRTLGIILHDAS